MTLELAAQLAAAPSADELCRLAVELARERLGLQRCSVWVRHGSILRGTFGTSLDGHTTDERERLFTFDKASAEVLESPDDEPGWRIVNTTWRDYRDGQNVPVGDGPAGVTALRSSQGAVGLMFNDNALTGEPLDPAAQARLASFGRLVGELLRQRWESQQGVVLAGLAADLAAGADLESLRLAVLERTDELFGWDAHLLAVRHGGSSGFDVVNCIDTIDGRRIEDDPGWVSVERYASRFPELFEGRVAVRNRPEPESGEALLTFGSGRRSASLLFAPVMVAGELLAVISVQSYLHRRYGQAEADVLLRVAHLVAQALDRVRHAQAVEDAAAENAALLSAIPDVCVVFDAAGIIRAVPTPDRIMVADSVDELLDRSIDEIWPAWASIVHKTVERTLAERRPQRVMYQLDRNGRRRWLEGHTSPLGEHVVWVTRDVTEHKRVEEELADSLAMLEQAAEVAGIGFWLRDLTDDSLRWSDTTYQIHGLDPGTPVKGADFDALVHPDDLAALHATNRGITPGVQPRPVQFRFRRGDEWRHGLSYGAPSRDEQGQPARLIGVIQDVTDRVRAEEERRELQAQLSHASKMEAVGQLAGGVAHDFNNLLTTIQGYADLILTGNDLTPAVRDDLGEIHTAADRATSLTRQLLAFSRRQLVQPAALDVNAVVEGVSTLLRRLLGERIVLRSALAPLPCSVLMDRHQLEQVLMNLAVNARDAMLDGGDLKLSVRHTELSAQDVVAWPGMQPGSYVELRLSDTGHGMTAEVRERIFEPFFTTKPVGQGTGLGLATVYGIIRQNGGWVFCESSPGNGACFTIMLPRQEAAAAVAEPRPSDRPGGSESILLAEDEAAVRTLTARILSNAGYRVTAAADAETALRSYEALEGRVDLLVSDVVMPGLNGPELADRLRLANPDLPVLFVSGYTADALVGGAPLLRKPFGPSDLLRQVRVLLDQR